MKENDRYCKGCIYRVRVGNEPCCNYILATKQRRPRPAGKGCTVKDTDGQKRRVGLVEATT